MPRLFSWLFHGGAGRALTTLMAFAALFVIVELFDKSRYLGHGLTSALLAEYIALKLPFMLGELLPVIVLVAVSLHVSELNKSNEIVAMRACGLGVSRLVQPMIFLALLFALLGFALSEWVTPITNARLDVMERVYIQHKSEEGQQGVQWLHDNHRFFRLTPLGKTEFKLTMIETDEHGIWLKRLDATRAHYDEMNRQWQLYDIHIAQPDQSSGLITSHYENLNLASESGPQQANPPSPGQMRFAELSQYVSQLKQAGVASAGFEFSLGRKIAAPVASLVMALLAIALCVGNGGRFGRQAFGIMAAISLGLIFYVLGSITGLLTSGGRLPPLFAAWLPDLFFGGLAAFLLLEREGH